MGNFRPECIEILPAELGRREIGCRLGTWAYRRRMRDGERQMVGNSCDEAVGVRIIRRASCLMDGFINPKPNS